MAYTPSTLTIVSWSSPLTIQPYDLISGLDDAVNSIVSSHGGSLRNFMNTELAKIPTYLSAELTSVYNETNASAVAAAASAVTASNAVAPFTSHLIDTANPHSVTKAQVGLGNCDNTTDLLKPISTATQSALDLKASIANMELKAPLASPTFTGTVKVEDANVTAYGQNYLINGGFDRWDYATSQTTSSYGSDNRWANYNAGSTKTHSRVSSGDTERALFNSPYFSRTVVSSVVGISNYTRKSQYIENVTKLAGKTITVSFWAKADTTKNIAISLYQGFGTGGTPSAEIGGIGAQQIALTSTWQKKTITITLPSIVGKTLGTDGVHTTVTGLNFWFEAGSNYNIHTASLGHQSGTFDIAEVQLEEGSVATPWTPYNGEFGGEEQACQRYYESSFYGAPYTISNLGRWIDVRGFANNQSTSIPYKVTKRAVPSVYGMWNPITGTSGRAASNSGTDYIVTVPEIHRTHINIANTSGGAVDAMFIHYFVSSEL